MTIPKMMIGDYVYIAPNYCETEEERFIVYEVLSIEKDGMTVIAPLENDPDSILKMQTYIHCDKLQVIYEP